MFQHTITQERFKLRAVAPHDRESTFASASTPRSTPCRPGATQAIIPHVSKSPGDSYTVTPATASVTPLASFQPEEKFLQTGSHHPCLLLLEE
ncbi:hypothetical protein FOCC_FOCC015279 [Frankliniella occidentalis]|nr:hypothetical protein FOCC_FOCC015279 [Frankliniella occidentalis]